MLTLLEALSVSLIVGVSDYLGGSVSRRISPLAVIVCSQSLSLLVIGAVLAARGAAPPSPGFIPWAMLAGLCGAINLAFFYRALSIGPMSVVAPVATLSSLLPVVVGLLAGDHPVLLVESGVLAALLGVLVTVGGAQGQSAAPGDLRRALPMAAVSAVAGGCWILAMREGSREGDPFWTAAVFRGSQVALVGLALGTSAAIGPIAAVRANARALIAIGVLEALAAIANAHVLQVGLVSVVAVLTSLFPIVTMLIARRLLHEEVTPVQAAGVGLVLVGVLLALTGSG
jgi:drug/metabolite transporter (DMT)-like permease